MFETLSLCSVTKYTTYISLNIVFSLQSMLTLEMGALISQVSFELIPIINLNPTRSNLSKLEPSDASLKILNTFFDFSLNETMKNQELTLVNEILTGRSWPLS